MNPLTLHFCCMIYGVFAFMYYNRKDDNITSGIMLLLSIVSAFFFMERLTMVLGV